MRRMMKTSAAILIASVAVAYAQVPQNADDTKSTVAQPVAGQPASPGPPTRREACRSAVKQQGLKAQAASDQIQICLAQARLDCTKEAVTQAVPNAGRRDYIRTCVNGDRPDR